MKARNKQIMAYVLSTILGVGAWISTKVASKYYEAYRAPDNVPVVTSTEETETVEVVTESQEGKLVPPVNYSGEPENVLRICEYLPILPEDGGGEVYVDPDLQRYMLRLSEENDLPFEFVLAICYVETKFNPTLNNAGLNANGTTDWGLMQLNDAYIGSFCELYNGGAPIDMLNAYDNAKIGINVLGDINSRQPTLYDVACSYNMGEYGWEEYKTNVSVSWHYGDKVLEYYGYIKEYFRNMYNTETQR